MHNRIQCTKLVKRMMDGQDIHITLDNLQEMEDIRQLHSRVWKNVSVLTYTFEYIGVSSGRPRKFE